jgi:DNA repair exonuclease SbcCD ATPase subunit
MTTENGTPQKPSFGRRIWLAFKNLLWLGIRALLVILIIAGVGAVIYYGAPVLINDYLLKDVKVNSSKIKEIQTQAKSESERTDKRLDDLQSRVDTLEIQQDDFSQAISELESQLTALGKTLTDHAALLESMQPYGNAIDDLHASLTNLETQYSAIEADLKEIQNELDSQFKAVEKTLAANQEEMDSLKAQLEARGSADLLRQELELLKVMELITRVRVSIGQENLGLAKEDLQAAQNILTDLQAEASAGQVTYLAEISQRLSLVVENISDSPDLAEEDLEVAWQMLLQGLPDEPIPEEDTASETGSEAEATPTPTPTPEP